MSAPSNLSEAQTTRPVLRRAIAAVQNADRKALLLGAVGITAQPSHPIGTRVRSTVPGYPWKGVLLKPDPDLPECPYNVKWDNGMVEACLEDEIVVLRGVVS